jgi:hypothetical protein
LARRATGRNAHKATDGSSGRVGEGCSDAIADQRINDCSEIVAST